MWLDGLLSMLTQIKEHYMSVYVAKINKTHRKLYYFKLFPNDFINVISSSNFKDFAIMYKIMLWKSINNVTNNVKKLVVYYVNAWRYITPSSNVS